MLFALLSRDLSGVLRFPLSNQSTDRLTLGYLSHRPGLSPDRKTICRVFRGFRYPISRQTDSRVSESPSWADARQKSDLSGVLRFSVSDQSKDEQYPIQKDHRSGIETFSSV